MKQSVAITLAQLEEKWARQSLDMARNRVANLKAKLASPCLVHLGEPIDDKSKLVRELQVALSAKVIAEKDLRSAARVRRAIAGEGTRKSVVVRL